ncbi:4'-phosphopantetheinyl transferase superfamily protein [Clavibacter sp. VKM Ac-2873]|uniref:4'-phosphopantetheinyl transferase family protein n=1 Tax=Clavibacter sp. VKM Ac-2873 TaxID=2783813 RepID=UPI00188C784C|nr:4'-phosphopantetheinyl transferase superfamily protein [Clavibacter sp. VKM Ac-2873]
MLDAILPAGAVLAEERGPAREHPMHPTEASAVARAVPSRRREFAATRACARTALAALQVLAGEAAADAPGSPLVAIPKGRGGDPVWPRGVIGSLTHCAGYRAAVVAGRDALRTIGIDAEPHAPLPAEARDVVGWADELAPHPPLGTDVHADCVLFSAKESVGKAHYARYREWLGFADLHVTLHPGGAFTARRRAPGPVPFPAYRGSWRVAEGLVLTCAWLAVPRIPSAVPRPA